MYQMKGKNKRESKNSAHPLTLALVNWYSVNQRDLPWRQSKDPYIIWLSEVILQQTRVEQGLPYFLRFSEAFPDVQSLATADMQHVAKLWQGLGYYSRAQNLHTAAKQVLEDFHGIFPNRYHDLIKLKGVGEYTAAAVASIAAEEPVPALDGNAFRVFSRLFEIKEFPDKPGGRMVFRQAALSLIEGVSPSDFNQAVMELGALVCKPLNPLCSSCPLREFCPSKHGGWENLPLKKNKPAVKKMDIHYLVLTSENRVLMQKRGKEGLWKNLHDFPMLEEIRTAAGPSIENAIKQWIIQNLKKKKDIERFKILNNRPLAIEHQLTHRKITARFWELSLEANDPKPRHSNLYWLNMTEMEKAPVPKIIEKYLSKSTFF
jgi:A/G-specific adenine glycosylase